MLKVGDWVTQYSAGYWQVAAIYPKYADQDYASETSSWKKGDRLSDWVILKKGFTPKMKPSNACECTDAQWCRPVSADILAEITRIFAETPKAKAKFDSAPSLPSPFVASLLMNLTPEQAETFQSLLAALPERFTSEQLQTAAAAFRPFASAPPATHILYVFSYPWEMTEAFDPLHFPPLLLEYDPQGKPPRF